MFILSILFALFAERVITRLGLKNEAHASFFDRPVMQARGLGIFERVSMSQLGLSIVFFLSVGEVAAENPQNSMSTVTVVGPNEPESAGLQPGFIAVRVADPRPPCGISSFVARGNRVDFLETNRDSPDGKPRTRILVENLIVLKNAECEERSTTVGATIEQAKKLQAAAGTRVLTPVLRSTK